MIKFVPDETTVVFSEIPDEITLALNISNCQNRCVGCHSPWLRKNIGEELTENVLDDLIARNGGITTVCLMGEGNDRQSLLRLSDHIRSLGLKSALFSGRPQVEDEIFGHFDYVKVGPYIERYGPLDKETTNQRLYENDGDGNRSDITYKFWRKQ